MPLLTRIYRDHGVEGLPYPTAEDSCVSGVCTGALAAAAVSSAHSTSSLLPLALHTVAVAFRLGALAWNVGARISSAGEDENFSATSSFVSWATAIAGISVSDLQEKLRLFAEQKVRSTREYLGIVGRLFC